MAGGRIPGPITFQQRLPADAGTLTLRTPVKPGPLGAGLDHAQRGAQSAGSGQPSQPTQPAPPSPNQPGAITTTRVIADANFRTDVSLWARYFLQFSPHEVQANIVWVHSWDQFRTAVRAANVDRLIIYMHGSPGSLILNHVHHPMTQIVASLGTPLPTVREINVEGCNIGQNPREMAAFARALHASSISAFTYFHLLQHVTITVPPGGQSEQQIRDMRRRWERFLLPNQLPPGPMGRHVGNHLLVAEWFRLQHVTDGPPIPTGVGSLPPADFRLRSSAVDVTYTSDQPDLPGVTWQSAPAFERVTVQMVYGPHPAAPPPSTTPHH